MEKRRLFSEIVTKGRFPEDLLNKIDSSESELSIDINNECNLHCKHCYWGITKLHKEPLSLDEIKQLIDRAIDSGTKLFAFAGREPFLTDRIIHVLRYIKEKKKDNNIKYGVVSNGTRVSGYVDALKELDLDYIDISIDGTREIHDKIRRDGAYDAATGALKQIINGNVVRKVFVSMCYNKLNSATFFEAIDDLAEKGVTNFCILPYIHSERGSPELKITFDDFLSFLRQLEHYSPKKPVEIMIDLEWYMIPSVKMMLDEGVMNLERVKEDAAGNLYTKIENANCKIYVKFGFVDLNRFVVTADGYFGNIHMKSNNDYYLTASGNVREKDILEMIPKTINASVHLFNRSLQKMNKEITITSLS
jgi:MoaA/NifB/PqqE/SkfB family radical SAM enzyme